MEVSNFLVKTGRGKNTPLDKKYRALINDVINTLDEDYQFRWETYNLIIKELVKLENGLIFNEIKYRFTDGENPNEVILDILNRVDESDVNTLVWLLKSRVEEFLEEDFFKRFT